MTVAYYLDTCIWRDHYENRYGFDGRRLGDYATRLFMNIIKNKHTILFSKLTVTELKTGFSEQEVEYMLFMLSRLEILKRTDVKKEDYTEARELANQRGVPVSDALHAIVARNNNAILVSQDKHFQKLKDIVNVKQPDELI